MGTRRAVTVCTGTRVSSSIACFPCEVSPARRGVTRARAGGSLGPQPSAGTGVRCRLPAPVQASLGKLHVFQQSWTPGFPVLSSVRARWHPGGFGAPLSGQRPAARGRGWPSSAERGGRSSLVRPARGGTPVAAGSPGTPSTRATGLGRGGSLAEGAGAGLGSGALPRGTVARWWAWGGAGSRAQGRRGWGRELPASGSVLC